MMPERPATRYARIVIPYAALVPDNRKSSMHVVAGRPRVGLSKRYKTGKNEVRDLAALAYRGPVLFEELDVRLMLWVPDQRQRDVTNLWKLLLDAMKGVVFHDDYQVRRHVGERVLVDRDDPRAILEVFAYE